MRVRPFFCPPSEPRATSTGEEKSSTPEIQARIAAAPSTSDAARIGRDRSLPADPDWRSRRVDAMRWTTRRKLETAPDLLLPALDLSADRPIVEISTRDPFWGAAPCALANGRDGYRGRNVLGRLWMELRQHLRDRDSRARAAAWPTHAIQSSAPARD